MGEDVRVKVFRIEGIALFSPDRVRRWQQFTIDIRALKPEHALERLYSELGSRHKVKRQHVKILSIKEVKPEESKYKLIKDLESVSGWFIE